MLSPRQAVHVSIIATPDTQVAPLSGLFETLTGFHLLSSFERDLPSDPFVVEIVSVNTHPMRGASGLTLAAHRAHHEVERTDVVIVPLMMVAGAEWIAGRHPALVEWLRAMHRQGATLCSACTGVLLLAETGLLEGREATIHWAFAPTFRRNFPDVRLRLRERLVTAGARHEFVMTGGVTSWHELALYLIAREVGTTAARAMARLMALQWDAGGQAPYISFMPATDHGDAVVLRLQEWLKSHYALANPVEELVRRSGLARRSVERRFTKATGLSPIQYAQNLRVEEAKRLLERTDMPVERISHEVGYDNTAFLRRLFKRTTRLTPAAYRRKFQLQGIGRM